MLMIALQSGSNGNCIYVEAGNRRILFDAGISGRQAAIRLAAAGRDIRSVNALFVSHEHADHARCMGVYGRKYGLPIYATQGTARAATTHSRYNLGAVDELRDFRAGETIRLGSVRIETIRTPHDAAESVGFVVDDGHRRLGILTDLGHVFGELEDTVRSLDALLIESNYDLRRLREGAYPAFLKTRIEGPAGHISNDEAARLIERAGRKLEWACLGHLSAENNSPELALRTHRGRLGSTLPLCVASRDGAIAPLLL